MKERGTRGAGLGGSDGRGAPRRWVDFAPGAEDNDLATLLGHTIADRVEESTAARADFKAMRGAVLVVAHDHDGASTAATFRFDHGRLTVHDGQVGVPTVTLLGELDTIRKLPDLVLTRGTRLPRPAGRRAAFEGAASFARSFLGGDLRLYGAIAHARLWLRFARVLARASDERFAVEGGER